MGGNPIRVYGYINLSKQQKKKDQGPCEGPLILSPEILQHLLQSLIALCSQLANNNVRVLLLTLAVPSHAGLFVFVLLQVQALGLKLFNHDRLLIKSKPLPGTC